MTRKVFDRSLLDLKESVLTLGVMAEQALGRSVALLEERNIEGSRELIQEDRALDRARYAIETEALTLIATQGPIAGDVRALAAALFISNELERIGDYAKGIARVNIRIGAEPVMKPLVDIPRMAAAGQKMLRRALQAYMEGNPDLALAIIPDDGEVDALSNQVYADLMTRVLQDISRIRQANQLLMAAHNLERTADRVTNICERVVYIVTGELIDTAWDDQPMAFSAPALKDLAG
jgi:phosphate transport system protein